MLTAFAILSEDVFVLQYLRKLAKGALNKSVSRLSFMWNIIIQPILYSFIKNVQVILVLNTFIGRLKSPIIFSTNISNI